MTPELTLEQRITARLHEQIGDLITEDDLKAMVARGIETALFSPRNVVTSRGYGASYQEQRPSVVEEQVTKCLTEKMATAVDAWIAANPDKLEAAVKAVIQDGAAESMMQALDRRFQFSLPNALVDMQNRGLLPRGN